MMIRSMPPASSALADRPDASAAADDRLAGLDHLWNFFNISARGTGGHQAALSWMWQARGE